MNPHEMHQMRLEIATQMIIASLKNFHKSNPDCTIHKRDLFFRASQRSKTFMDDFAFDYSIPEPNERFYCNSQNWSDICFLAARLHHYYIIPNPPGLSPGIKGGTFEEYQKIPNTKASRIAQGLADKADIRAEIIKKQGGRTTRIQIALLTSGE